MLLTISQVRYKIKLRRSTAWSSWIRYIITHFFINLRNTISTQTPHPGYFTQIFYFFKISQKFKEETRNIRIYSQVMAVCVQRTEFCQGRRDLTRTLQRITSK